MSDDPSQPLRILVVEDDAVDRMAVVRALHRAQSSFSVSEAETLSEGRELLADRFDCLVLDFQLPDGDAGTFLTSLQDPSGFVPVPVVVVTGAEDERSGLESLQRGAQDYLLKSEVNSRTLSRAVRYAIERQRLFVSRKEQEELQRHSQRLEAIGQLAAGLAQDFNNMLTAIIGFTEQALGRLTPAPVSDEAVDAARGALDQAMLAACRSADLTRRILTFAPKQVQPEVLEVRGLVSSTRPLLSRLLGASLGLSYVLGEEGYAELDRSQVEQILLTLALNSRDAMPGGGLLTVAVENVDVEGDAGADAPSDGQIPAGPYVRLRVTDTGTGMKEETARRAFEAFFTTKGEGTGLGLAVVHGIVLQSRGHVHVESAPGEGTSVEVYFPRVAKPDRPEPPPAKSLDQPNTETILLVEDEELVRELLVEVLGSAGFTVIAARDGEHALELSRSLARHVDLLLADMLMPNLGGRELAEQLLRERAGLKVLLMSGYNEERLGSELFYLGVQLVGKPVSPRVMVARIREILDGPTPRAVTKSPSSVARERSHGGTHQ